MATAILNKECMQYEQVVTMETIICYKCAIPFAVPSRYKQHLRDSQEGFYCPNGHVQYYSKSTEQILREKLKQLRSEKEAEEQRLKALAFNKQQEADNWKRQWENQLQDKKNIAAKLKRTENRIAHGVCPCCNRTFQNLAEHMATKHPEKMLDKPKRGRPRKEGK